MSTYTPVATQTLGSAAASVTFSSIPQGYTDLILVASYKSANPSGTESWGGCRLNNDSSSSYSTTNLRGNGTSATSSRNTNRTEIESLVLTASSGTAGTNIFHFMNYSNSTTYKTILQRGGAVSWGYLDATVSLYRKTDPITSITLNAEDGAYNIAAGSTFSLYGIQVGDKAQKAQGGNVVTSDGTYVYHTFTSSGAFIPSQALTVDYLVVAGGGGGSIDIGGGGGAGGLRSTVTATGGGGSLESALSLTAQSYSVIIGAGGTGGTSSSGTGSNGNNSVFGSITSIGGGNGALRDTNNAGIGGSGGGASGVGSSPVRNGGAGTTNQGYAGGANSTVAQTAAGGGGGAGAVGSTNGGLNNGANGGAGVAVSISGSSVYYAGGGGGGESLSNSPATGGTGGVGGGGNGGTAPSTLAQSGTSNTGGGGGGGGRNASNYTPAGSGGSGIVIVRYLA